MSEETPQYEHNCSACTFLGRHNNVDLYFCANGPTLIARYSSYAPNYSSGLPFISSFPDIKEAAKRALAKGLISTDQTTGKCGGETVGQALEEKTHD